MGETIPHPVADLDSAVAEGGLGTQEEALGRRFPHSPDNLLGKILAVKLVHTLDDSLHQLAGGGVVGVFGDRHHPDALAPEHGLEGHGVLALAGEAGEFPDENYLEGGGGLAALVDHVRNWGRSAIRPLSASSTYSRATV